MKTIQEKIKKETKDSIKIRELAFDTPYEQSQELRKKQTEKYNKIKFLQGLNEAMEKIEYIDKNGKKISRKKRKKINNSTFSMRINDEIFIKFKELCNKNGKDFSKVVREFIERYVEENENN